MHDLLQVCFILNRFSLLHELFNECFIFLDVHFYIYELIKTKLDFFEVWILSQKLEVL